VKYLTSASWSPLSSQRAYQTQAYSGLDAILRLGSAETFDIGAKSGTPIDDRDYQVPFKFTGKIDKLTITVEPPELTPEDEKKLMESAHAPTRWANPAPENSKRAMYGSGRSRTPVCTLLPL
jgi:hypothetical protein